MLVQILNHVLDAEVGRFKLKNKTKNKMQKIKNIVKSKPQRPTLIIQPQRSFLKPLEKTISTEKLSL